MAYRFRLETVLTYRRSLEEQVQLRLAREQRLLDTHLDRLDHLKAERRQIMRDLESAKRKQLAAPMFSNYMECIDTKEWEIRAQAVTVESQRRVVDEAREELQDKMKDRKVMERAKEQDYNTYLRGYLRKEQNDSDEQALLRFGREKVLH